MQDGGQIMRGVDDRTGELFSHVDLEARVRQDHPLRAIRSIVNAALAALEQEFARLYAPIGRPSIPPDKLLRARFVGPCHFNRAPPSADANQAGG